MAVCIDDVTEGGFGLRDRARLRRSVASPRPPWRSCHFQRHGLSRGDWQGGLKIDIQPLDWGTLSQHRKARPTTKEAIGWLEPVHPLATPRPNDVAGFPCDEELQRLRRSWWEHRRSRTRPARRPDPGAGVPGRAVHQWRPVEAVHGGADECLRAGGDDGAGVGAGDASSWTVLTAPLNISGLQDVACRRTPLAAHRSAGLMRATVPPRSSLSRPGDG